MFCELNPVFPSELLRQVNSALSSEYPCVNICVDGYEALS